MEPVGPSAVLNPAQAGTMPKALEKDEIAAIVGDFRAAALRVKLAGFDGVEIHSAHGYLLSQFLSPLTNTRTDEYGGDLAGRMKIHIEIITAVRAAVGDDFLILLRLGAADYMECGLTIEDSKIAAHAFEKAGVDMLDISGGMCRFSVPNADKPGYFAPLSQAIKEVVSIPVMVTGGISHAEDAEQILREGKADLIGVGRAIYQDSLWAKNAVEGTA
jgi:2,4-dienoyl-CoA reductase-like NADH-dependent reductase (Old Yellow Enzyme family)